MRRPASGRPMLSPSAGGDAYGPGGTGRLGQDKEQFYTKITGGDATAGYLGYEVWLRGSAPPVATKVDGGRVMIAAQPGFAIDGSEFAVGDIALTRLGPGEGGRQWELAAFGASAGGGGSNCHSKLAGLRANECVVFSTPGNALVDARSFGGRWVAAAGGWKGWDFFETGDGVTKVALFRKTQGGMGLALIGETQTWYATEMPQCVGGKTRFAAPYCPPDGIDGSGSDSDAAGTDCESLAGCTDHTFFVDVYCASCVGDGEGRARATICETFSSAPVTLYLTITGVTGDCSASLVGLTVPLYYLAAGGHYAPLQADIDALPWPCGTAVGRPATSGYLFQISGCNVYWNGANKVGADPPVSTDPFVYEGSWNGQAPCCPIPSGTVEFTISEVEP